jgi:succinate dehydrogenase / fumarate reductase flavoprotein subunit
MHGSNRLGGNSLSDLLVFGKRAGEHAAAYVDALPKRPKVATVRRRVGGRRGARPAEPAERRKPVHAAAGPAGGDGRPGRHHPPAGRADRRAQALQELKQRVANVGATGGRQYNPGWHLALDLRNMLVVSECTAKAALEREESRGGHTREDFPAMSPEWRQVNLVCSIDKTGDVHLERKPLPKMREELITLFDRVELSKYLTEDELDRVRCAGRRGQDGGEVMGTKRHFRVWRGDSSGGEIQDFDVEVNDG